MSTKNGQTAEDASAKKVTFNLVPEYSERLAIAAKAARTKPNQFARSVLITALEMPSRDELVEELRHIEEDVSALRHEMTMLTNAVAALLEFSMVSALDLTDQEAKSLMTRLFTAGDESS